MSWYVGHMHSGKYTPFLAKRKPTEGEHGRLFSRVNGPFKFRHGAELYAMNWNRGHFITGKQADKLAAEAAESQRQFLKHGNPPRDPRDRNWPESFGNRGARGRRYRVIWVRDDKGTSGVIAPGPFTHKEAVTVLSKVTKRPWRRDLLQEITQSRRTHGNEIISTHYSTSTSAAQQRALIAMRQAEKYMGSTPGTRRARGLYDDGDFTGAAHVARQALAGNKRRKKRKR